MNELAQRPMSAKQAQAQTQQKSTEQLLESLVETFRTGCVILENASANRNETLANTLDLAIRQMQQLADHTRITDSEGLFGSKSKKVLTTAAKDRRNDV